ncbi:MAG: hypothetical protein FWD40_09790, partial [Treponema sp.]|nr:hypothetical protein [Treponema sp.]
PGPRINRVLEQMELPIQLPAERIFISLFPAPEEKYEAIIRLRIANASQARGLVTIFSLARSFMGPSVYDEDDESGFMAVMMAVLFANPPALDGRDINIKTAALSEKDIALLLDVFSVY